MDRGWEHLDYIPRLAVIEEFLDVALSQSVRTCLAIRINLNINVLMTYIACKVSLRLCSYFSDTYEILAIMILNVGCDNIMRYFMHLQEHLRVR